LIDFCIIFFRGKEVIEMPNSVVEGGVLEEVTFFCSKAITLVEQSQRSSEQIRKLIFALRAFGDGGRKKVVKRYEVAASVCNSCKDPIDEDGLCGCPPEVHY
jgi:hypothetical protein